MLYVAAFLSVVLGLAHSVLGERYILIRLSRTELLPKSVGGVEFTAFTSRSARILRIAWHLLTLTWFAFAVLLVQLARNRFSAANTAQIIGCLFIASGLPVFISSRGKHWSWLLFFLIGGLSLTWSFF